MYTWPPLFVSPPIIAHSLLGPVLFVLFIFIEKLLCPYEEKDLDKEIKDLVLCYKASTTILI